MPYYKVVKENETKTLKDYSKPSAQIPSYIGMLDISTVNDTLEKVQAKYGTDTNWIQHSGYVLRGATSGVVAKSATKTGGSDDAIVPYHKHTVPQFTNSSNGGITNGISGGAHNHAGDITNGDGTPSQRTSAKNGVSKYITLALNDGEHYHNLPDHTHVIKAHNTDYAGTSGNTTNANVPNYKSVYIWERIE